MKEISPKRILITASTYPRWKNDKTPSFVQYFAEGLSESGHDVTVLAPHYKGAKKREKHGGVDVRRFQYAPVQSWQNIVYEGGGVDKIKKNLSYGLKLLGFMLALFFSTFRFAISKKVDIINPHWAIPQGFVAVIVGFLTRKKVFLTVHGGDIASLNGPLMTKIKRFTLKHSDMVFVNSNDTKKECSKILKREYTVIAMGIKTELFKQEGAQTRSKKAKPGLNILFVGRLAQVKGVEYLVDALNMLKKDGVKFHASILGSGDSEQGLKDKVAKYGLGDAVDFLGWVPQEELGDYYRRADVFVGPSLQEAQGLVFVEALATGTPVVATRVGGIVDAVDHGVNGFLVPPKSSKALHRELKKLADDPKLLKELKSNARSSVMKKYDWSVVIDNYNNAMSEAYEK